MAKRVPYAIVVVSEAEAELNGLKAFEHRKVVDAVAQNLKYDASSPSKRRKKLEGLIPGFMFEPPLWELKIGDLRVFMTSTRRIARSMYER